MIGYQCFIIVKSNIKARKITLIFINPRKYPVHTTFQNLIHIQDLILSQSTE